MTHVNVTLSHASAPTLWIGLGNPGAEYARSRHNYGKIALELFRNALNGSNWTKKSNIAKLCSLFPESKVPLLLALSESYMNLSGTAVERLLVLSKASPAQLMVVHDDLDLPVGKIQLKFSGGCAGHNGLKHIRQCLKTPDFWRLRIGISRPVDCNAVVSYVLAAPSSREHRQIISALEQFFETTLNPWMRTRQWL